MSINLSKFNIYNNSLSDLKNEKIIINTINAHSYNISGSDLLFREALLKSDVLLPDGISIIYALKWLYGYNLKKVAGADLFFYEMNRIQQIGGKCFFLGSTELILSKITKRIENEYPQIKIKSYSPPYKLEFTKEDNSTMLKKINTFQPDVLFIGMTAPKQEKWAYQHYSLLDAGHICSIGAVFDFYAGSVKRAPKWMIKIGLEWFYRLIKEPGRMWKRYLIGNTKFIYYIVKEKIASLQSV